MYGNLLQDGFNSLRLSFIVVGIQTGSGNSLIETGNEILYKTEFTSLRLCMITFDWAIGI